MPLLKTEALILRTFEYSESSLIVWFFTRDHGRLHAIAKGARRARSDFEGALEPFVQGEIEVYRSEKRELDILKSLELTQVPTMLRASLARLERAYYCAELLSKAVQPDDPAPELYGEAVATFAALSGAPLGAGDSWVLFFEGRLLRALGLFPSLTCCVSCGVELAESRVSFDVAQGGVVCEAHAQGLGQLSRGSLLGFRDLVDQGPDGKIRLMRGQVRELRALLARFWTYHLETELKTARALSRG